MNDFRLARDVRPQRYRLHFDLDLDGWTSTGSARIDLTTQRPQRELVLHALDLKVSRAMIDGAAATGWTYDTESQTVTLALTSQLAPGAHVVEIEWDGEIKEDLRGLYRSTRGEERYAATQFEEASARDAFPCFDEPEFKARFAVELVHDATLVAVGNAPIEEQKDLGKGRRLTRFKEMPPISSYLVAFTVGPYEATPEARTSTGTPVRVLLPPGPAGQGLYARDAHVRSLEWLEPYTAIPYPYAKCDGIGIPDFSAGAMENPGAITYRTRTLAADKSTASVAVLKGAFSTVAHELTHMWWGDLVTMAWWNDLWLNESFASFVGDKCTMALNPEWGYERDIVQQAAAAFSLDSLLSTHAISMDAKNVEEASQRFDAVSYIKGQLVLRMIEGWVGEDAFRSGVRIYLQRHREANATADDFWRALAEASGSDVTGLAHGWIFEPGHPLVRCAATAIEGGLEVRFTQERMLADPDAKQTGQVWPVPMVLVYGTASSVVRERYRLDGREGSVRLPGARWWFPNGGASGFFRYALDDRSVTLLAGALGQLSPVEKLDLLGCTWSLVRARKIGVAAFLELVAGLRGESDRAVLQNLHAMLAWLSDNAVTDAARPAFEKLVESIYRPQLDALGWDVRPDDSPDEREKRSLVIVALGDAAASPDVRAEARRRVTAHLAGSRMSPDIAGATIAVAARDGDNELFDTYLRRMKEVEKTDAQEEARFRGALTEFEDPKLAHRFADTVLSDAIRVQDRYLLIEKALGQRHARLATWQAVRSRWASDIAPLDPTSKQRIITGTSQLTPKDLVPEVNAFLEAQRAGETRETADQAIERLRTASASAERIAADLPAALGRTSARVAV